MSKVAVLTDSNSGITQVDAKELGVYVIPMPFFINNETYYEDIDLTQEQFFIKLLLRQIDILIVCFVIYKEWHWYYIYAQLFCIYLCNTAVTVGKNCYFTHCDTLLKYFLTLKLYHTSHPDTIFFRKPFFLLAGTLVVSTLKRARSAVLLAEENKQKQCERIRQDR